MAASEHTSPSAEQPAGRRPRVLGWIAQGLGVLLLVVVVLVAGIFTYLRTDAGLAHLARLIEGLASSEGSTLTIGSLEERSPSTCAWRTSRSPMIKAP